MLYVYIKKEGKKTKLKAMKNNPCGIFFPKGK